MLESDKQKPAHAATRADNRNAMSIGTAHQGIKTHPWGIPAGGAEGGIPPKE